MEKETLKSMAGNRQHIIHGLRDGIPIAMGYFAVTFSLGIIALLAGIVAAWFRLGLFPIASICCVIVYLLI